MAPKRSTARPKARRDLPIGSQVVGIRLEESERLFRDFAELTPYPYEPFVRSFDSFAEYERWRRAQTNPWLR